MGSEEPRIDRHDQGMDSSEQSNFSHFTRRAATAITLGILLVLAVLVVWRLLHALLIIFAAVLFAVFIRGLTNFVAAHTPLSPGWALVSVATGFVSISTAVVWLLAPAVSSQVSQIADKLPQAVTELQTWAEQFSLGRAMLDSLPTLQEIAGSDGIGWARISGAFSSVLGILTNILFVVFVGIYLAVDPAIYKRGMVRLVPLSYRTRAGEVLDTVSHQLGWWLVGRLLSMLAVTVLTTVGLWMLGIPLALVLGLLSGLLSFVPIIGPIASFFPAGLMALLVGPSYVLYTAFIYLGVQTLESYFITPLIQQRTVSLPPALILIAQLIAGILFGFIGIVVATPVAVLVIAVVNLVYVEDVLGDSTRYSEKIPGSAGDRTDSGRGSTAPGAEPHPAT